MTFNRHSALMVKRPRIKSDGDKLDGFDTRPNEYKCRKCKRVTQRKTFDKQPIRYNGAIVHRACAVDDGPTKVEESKDTKS